MDHSITVRSDNLECTCGYERYSSHPAIFPFALLHARVQHKAQITDIRDELAHVTVFEHGVMVADYSEPKSKVMVQ